MKLKKALEGHERWSHAREHPGLCLSVGKVRREQRGRLFHTRETKLMVDVASPAHLLSGTSWISHIASSGPRLSPDLRIICDFAIACIVMLVIITGRP